MEQKGAYNLKPHPDVVKLGLVSFLTDVSSEAIFSVFSVFLTTVIGVSASFLGVIEGLADFSASSLDYVSGWLTDKTGRRKSLTLLGYGFSTLAKFFLLIANAGWSLALFRIVERLGKSFRGPARDAWLADVSIDGNRGYSFGFHKALDKAGAIVGPLIAYVILSRLGPSLSTFRLLFIGAALTAVLAVVVLLLIKERPGRPHERDNIFKSWRELAPGFKLFLLPAGIFSLAYFSFSFLLLKAYTLGFSIADVVLLYALFNVSFVIFSIPVGILGDKIGRAWLIILEYLVYALMLLGFIFSSNQKQAIILFVIFGLFYAIDEAQSKAFVVDIEKERRGSAIGLYNFVTGLVYVPASIIAGFLWTLNSNYAFGFALVITLLALILFILLKKKITYFSSPDTSDSGTRVV